LFLFNLLYNQTMNKKLVVILLGPPGAGKGTQGMLLADKFDLYYFETSKILEESFKNAKDEDFVEIEGSKYFFKKEKELWEKGILCSPPFVTFLVKERIKELAKAGQDLLLSGSPRTEYEAKELLPLLEDLYGKENIKVVLIEISPEETVFRNTHRRICELMRHPILYSEETKNLKNCPLDGSKLVRREGLDDPETIKERLKQYKERTLPLFEVFKQRNIEVKKIDGKGTVAEVFQRVLNTLGL